MCGWGVGWVLFFFCGLGGFVLLVVPRNGVEMAVSGKSSAILFSEVLKYSLSIFHANTDLV